MKHYDYDMHKWN